MVIGLPDLEALFLGSPTAAEKLVLVTQLRAFLVDQRNALVSHVHPGVTVGGGSTGASATVWPAVPSAQDLASERLWWTHDPPRPADDARRAGRDPRVRR